MNKNTGESQVSLELLAEWRNKGILQKDEIAYQVADLFIAENVITRERRVINPGHKIKSESSRILKG